MFRHSGPDHVRHTTEKFLWCFTSTSQKVKVKRSELSSKLRLQRTVKILSNSFKKWSPPGQYLSFSTVDHIFTRQTTGSADHLGQSPSRHQHTDDCNQISCQRSLLHPSSQSLTQRRTAVASSLFCSNPTSPSRWPLPPPSGSPSLTVCISPSWLWCWWTTTCW